MDPTCAPELVPISTAARIAAKSPRTLRRLLAEGELTEYRDGRGRRFFDVDELMQLRPQPVARTSGSEGEHR